MMKAFGSMNPSRLNIAGYFLIPPIVARIYAIYVNLGLPDGEIALPILRGALSDVAVGAIIVLIVFPLRRIRSLFFSFWILWVLLLSLNIEHIKVNASNMNYKFLHLALASDFIEGSLLTHKNLYTFIVCLALSVLFIAICTRLNLMRKNLVFYLVSAMSFLAVVTISASTTHPYWIQMNPLEENIRSIFQNPISYTQTSIDEAVKKRFFSYDLAGNPIVASTNENANVLLIMIEGMSYDAIDSDALPNLKRLIDSSVSYSNFISLQRQTNRGLYALICGDYPNFLSQDAKADYVGVYGTLKKCLPKILGERGYSSVFMQSASLQYMRKDKFAEKVGFDEIIGNSYYRRALGRNKWGVDDRTLYSYALEKIRELSAENKKWFMTLLTTSTHHPFNVPGIFSPTEKQALEYADSAIGGFIDSLRDSGFLENTLILITTDESTGSALRGLQYELSKSRAFLIALVPKATEPLVSDGVFSQSDVQLSIADYLGIDPKGLMGRSIFRNYDQRRDLVFGNVYSSKVFYISRESRFYVCTYDLNCSAYKMATKSPFDGSLEPVDMKESDISTLKQVLAYNELNSDKLSNKFVFYEKNTSYAGNKFLLGDHKLSLNPGDTVTWRFKIKANGVIGVRAAVHEMGPASGGQYIFEDRKWVAAGETYDFSRKFVAPALVNLWTNITVSDSSGNGYLVKYLTVEVQRKKDQ